MKQQPMQPVVVDSDGVIRFQPNAIVSELLDFSHEHGFGLNEIAMREFSREDRCQLAQLIGYSVCGYHELSYVSDAEAAAASAAAREIHPAAGGCRDRGCELHIQEGEAMSETTEDLDCEALLDLLKMKAGAAKR